MKHDAGPHEFAPSRDEGAFWEAWFQDFANKHLECEYRPVHKLVEDIRGTDGFMVIRVQVKAERRVHETGNVFVEVVSNDRKGTPGWARCRGNAHRFYLLAPGLGLIWRVDQDELIRVTPTWERQYRTAPSPNPGYNTLGVLVPQRVFCEAVVVEEIAAPALKAEFRRRNREAA